MAGRSGSRVGRSVRAALLGGLLALGACGVELSDDAALTSGSGDGGVIGSPTLPTETTATPTTAPPPQDLDIEGSDGSEVNDIAANAIVDLEAYWEVVYPEIYDGEPYEPVTGGFYAMDSGTDPTTLPCGITDIEQVLYNAFYCPPDDAVAWDQEGLMPELASTYGDFTVAVVLAHEWGHAIQARAAVDEPTIVTELQADCFAGAWVRHVEQDDEARFDIATQDLDQALAGVLSLRDAPGSTADDPNAHGSGFDRVGAFQQGFEEGAAPCAEYTRSELNPYQFPFSSQDEYDTGGNLPLDGDGTTDGINQLAFESLDEYWTTTFPEISGGEDWQPLGEPVPFSPDDPPTCNGETVDQFRLFLCVPDNYVGYDNEQAMPQAWEIGDFAVGALYGTQYGLAVQEQLGEEAPDEVTATLRGDCYAGAWSAAMLPTGEEDQVFPAGLALSPGDLDEAVGVLLSFRSESDRQRQGPGFERVKAFRTGVLDGPEACIEVEAE